LKITFDPKCATEVNYDYALFGQDESTIMSQEKRHHGRNWPSLEFDGDTFWYYFHSDDSTNDWGWKFTVQAEVNAGGGLEGVEASAIAINAIADLMQNCSNPCIIASAIDYIPEYLADSKSLSDDICQTLVGSVIELSRRNPDFGPQCAEFLDRNMQKLFKGPVMILKFQFDMWTAPEGIHPDIVKGIDQSFARSGILLGELVTNESSWQTIELLLGILKQKTSNRHPEASEFLWRALSDSASFLLAGNTGKPEESWTRLMTTVKGVIELATIEVALRESLRPEERSQEWPPFFDSVLLPVFLGIAAMPEFKYVSFELMIGLCTSVKKTCKFGACTGCIAALVRGRTEDDLGASARVRVVGWKIW
jgi:hypothetical protein